LLRYWSESMRLSALVIWAFLVTSSVLGAQAQETLQAPAAFQGIGNRGQRARAIFVELGKVLTHPHCMNCHPAGDQPLQGAEHKPHYPPAHRAGTSVSGEACSTCHTDRSFTVPAPTTFQSIPGHPRWDLAPLSMAWEGKSIGEICHQIKDQNLNGGRDLALLQEHIAKDDLVAWGWNPGMGREPAPGSQELAGQLTQAWIDNGAECP
jgi:hypothetical protein